MPAHAKKPSDTEQLSGTSLYPVPGLELTSDINHELSLGRVTFISRQALLRRYRRFGLTKRHVDLLSGKEEWLRSHETYEQSATYATVRTSKTRKVDLMRAELLVREAVFLLASSQASSSAAYRQRAKVFGQVRGAGLRSSRSFTLKAGGLIAQSWNLSGDPAPLRLGSIWKEERRWHFWWPLISAIYGKSKVNRNYRGRLRRAAVALGQSTFSDSISQAFLLNVIALETLLCKRGESITGQLTDATWALHHWAVTVDRQELNEQIEQLYSLRSRIVHDGDLSGITVEHLSLSDAILFNTLNNICRARFRSVDEISEFATRVRAYEALGQKPKRLPRQFTWIGGSFTPARADRLRERMLP